MIAGAGAVKHGCQDPSFRGTGTSWHRDLTPSENTSVCQKTAWPSSCSGLAKWYNMDQMRLQ